MNIVPMTKLRRELRKWLNKNEIVHISRNGAIVAVLIPVDEYTDMYNCTEEYKIQKINLDKLLRFLYNISQKLRKRLIK